MANLEPEQIRHVLLRAVSDWGTQAWDFVFTSRRIIAIRKGGLEAAKLTVGPWRTAKARANLSREEYARFHAWIRGADIDSIARTPGNAVVENSRVQEVLLKGPLLLGTEPSIRFAWTDGGHWELQVCDFQRITNHLDPLQAVFGQRVRLK